MEEQEIDLRGLYNVLRRRQKFIIAFTFLVVALTAAILFTITPRYTASAKMLLDVVGGNLLDPDATTPSISLANALLDSEVELIESDPTQLSAFDQLDLANTDEFGASLSAIEKLSVFLGMEAAGGTRTGEALFKNSFEKFKESVAVRRQGLTFIIEVKAESENPERAADMANGVADAHIQQKLNKHLEDSLNAQRLLDNRIDATRELVESSEDRLQRFIFNNLDEIENKTADLQLASLRSTLDRLEKESSERAALIEQLEKNQGNIDWENLTSNLVSDSLNRAIQQRQELEARLERSSPEDEAALKAELAGLEKQLDELASAELTVLSAEQTKAPELTRRVQTDLRQRVFEIELPPSILTELYQIRTNADVARDQYERLVARASELQARSEVQTSDIRVISPATAPRNPSYPNKRLILMLAFIAGVGIAVGLAFIFDQFLGGINSDGQLEDIVSKRVASVVPAYRLPKEHADGIELTDAVELYPTSMFAESIRRIRSELDLSLRSNSRMGETGRGQVILVSSALPGEGKSTIAVSLAKATAISGSRTLIIDGDLRKPSVHKYLSIEPEAGLVEFLSAPNQSDKFSSSFKRNVKKNLDAVVGIARAGVPSDTLVSGSGFERLIASVKKHYDFVIIDTPPLLPVVDTSYLLGHADAAVLVVAFGKTSQSEVRKANRMLDQFLSEGVKTFPVLNKSDKIASGYGGQYDGYYDES
jgi:capsular exopolysaccharide synthesis family protein